MQTSELITGIDDELSRLRQVRALLSGGGAAPNSSDVARVLTNRPRKKRRLSAEARAKIAAAQKKRWARQKAASK